MPWATDICVSFIENSNDSLSFLQIDKLREEIATRKRIGKAGSEMISVSRAQI